MKYRALSSSLALLFGLFLLPHAVFSQQQSSSSVPLVVLTALNSPANDPVAQKLASTITSSIQLMVRLTGSVKVERADFLVPTTALHRAEGYYRTVGANGAIFGAVTPTKNGGYSIEIGLWNASNSAGKPIVLHRNISDILSSFSVADKIALEAASTIVGRKLAVGSLLVKGVRALSAYAVYADGRLLGRDRSSFHVLTGRRTIIIAKPGVLGDIPLQTFHVDIRQGSSTTISLQKKKLEVASNASPIGSTQSAALTTLTASGLDVYVAGDVGNNQPVYWENGTLVSLPLPQGTTVGHAYDVAVDQTGNIYVVGSVGSKYKSVPVYWKNRKEFILPTPSSEKGGRAVSIAIDNKDNVYIAGRTGDSYTYPVYWKNASLQQLPGQGIVTTGTSTGLAVDSKGTVDVSGYLSYVNFGDATPELWVNRKLETLNVPGPLLGSQAIGIALNQRGDVFVAGNIVPYNTKSSANEQTVPAVWDNGWLSTLSKPKGSANTATTAVAVGSSGTVYIAGYSDTLPLYWRDGLLYALPTGAGNPVGQAHGVYVSASGHVYIVGWIGNGSTRSPVYWKDGRLRQLALGSGDPTGRAYGITVVGSQTLPGRTAAQSDTGRVLVRVEPSLAKQGSISISIVGTGGHVSASGDGSKPWFVPLPSGDYELTAAIGDNSKNVYRSQVTVSPGTLETVTIR